MIPKTELVYSWIYNHHFNKDFTPESLKELKLKFQKFEELYYQNIEKILKLIEKYNSPWRKEFIPIYLVEKTLSTSFSDPLTLKYYPSEKELLAVLIHELIHNNLTKRYPNRKELHEYIAKVMEKVCSELEIDLEKERKDLEKRTIHL